MATITETNIKLYNSSGSILLNETVEGAPTSFNINEHGTSLYPGRKYRVGVYCINDFNYQSTESFYTFYTLIGVDTAALTPISGGFQFEGVIDRDVTSGQSVYSAGVYASLTNTFNNPVTITTDEQGFYDIEVLGLLKGTTYYVKPFVIDEFGRESQAEEYESLTTLGDILSNYDSTDSSLSFDYDFSNTVSLNRLTYQISTSENFYDYNEEILDPNSSLHNFTISNLPTSFDCFVRLSYKLNGESSYRFSNIVECSTI